MQKIYLVRLNIADAFLCSRQTVENVRKCLVTEGFDLALHGKKREVPTSLKRLDGNQEVQVIALLPSASNALDYDCVNAYSPSLAFLGSFSLFPCHGRQSPSI